MGRVDEVTSDFSSGRSMVEGGLGDGKEEVDGRGGDRDVVFSTARGFKLNGLGVNDLFTV